MLLGVDLVLRKGPVYSDGSESRQHAGGMPLPLVLLGRAPKIAGVSHLIRYVPPYGSCTKGRIIWPDRTTGIMLCRWIDSSLGC